MAAWVRPSGLSVGLNPDLPVSLPDLPGGINLGGKITNFTSSTPITKVRCNGMRSSSRLSWDRVRVCG